MNIPEIMDGIDLDHVIDLATSPGYSLVAVRLHAVIEQQREKLEQDLTLEETAKVRGMITGLKLALDMPRQMRQEYEAAHPK
jgi:hypothetical protein